MLGTRKARLLPVPTARWTLACGVVVAGLAAAPLAAQENPPSGGGYGCVANGNCKGSLYKDRSNLDKWWYPKCSQCHVVQAPPPADAVTSLTTYQRELVSNKRRFWAFHDSTLTDPVLRVLTPKSRMVDPRLVRSPYKELLPR